MPSKTSNEGFGFYGELFFAVLVDLIGMASYAVPGVGEALDIATAPFNVAYVLEMYDDIDEDGLWGEILATFAGIEELAPYIDIIPSATIAWIIKWYHLK